jgi:hypothetical protein
LVRISPFPPDTPPHSSFSSSFSLNIQTFCEFFDDRVDRKAFKKLPVLFEGNLLAQASVSLDQSR